MAVSAGRILSAATLCTRPHPAQRRFRNRRCHHEARVSHSSQENNCGADSDYPGTVRTAPPFETRNRTFQLLTPVSQDSHIPQGYQGPSPCSFGTKWGKMIQSDVDLSREIGLSLRSTANWSGSLSPILFT